MIQSGMGRDCVNSSLVDLLENILQRKQFRLNSEQENKSWSSKMAANRVLLGLIVACLCLIEMQRVFAHDCPSSSKVLNCTPKCLHDSECSAIGGKCCPNLCNGRSCVQPNLLGNSGSNTSPFNKNSAATGSYCGNVKCGTFEKCETDRSTKRPKCVRS